MLLLLEYDRFNRLNDLIVILWLLTLVLWRIVYIVDATSPG